MLAVADGSLDAASDSYAGFRLFDILEGKRKALKPIPPRPPFAELEQPIILPGGAAIRIGEDSIEGMDQTTESIEQVDEETAEELGALATQPASSMSSQNPTEAVERPPQVLAAERWDAQWQENLPEHRKPRTSKAYIRAYALWHHIGLSVEEIAVVLREPPLLSSTVTNYILESIRLERLPYDETRVGDLLKKMPDSITRTRYRNIRAHVG